MAVGGLVGTLIKGKVDIEVWLGSISRISRDKHGRSDSVLNIETAEARSTGACPTSTSGCARSAMCSPRTARS